MTHPIPQGTRDVLPDEMRELRALSERLRRTFEQGGYGEVWTPALEYEEVLRTGDERAAGAGYRLSGIPEVIRRWDDLRARYPESTWARRADVVPDEVRAKVAMGQGG